MYHAAAWSQTGPRRPRTCRRLLIAISVAFAALGGPVWGSQQESAERLDLRAERHYGDLVHIFTGDVIVPSGVERHGAIVCIGGNVVIEGEVTRDVIVIFGSLEINGGAVRHSVVGVLSKLTLRDAEIRRDLFNVAGGMTRDNTYVGGQLFDLGILGAWFPGLLTLMLWLRVLSLLFVFVLLVLLVALAPDRVRVIADEAPVRYVSAFFVGALTYVGLLLLVTLAIPTVIGLPVIYLAYVALKWLGLAGMFYAVGRRFGRGLGFEMSPLGAVLLVYTLYAAVLLLLSPLGLIGLAAISMFRVVFFCFFEVPAVGLVLLTRAGTRSGAKPISTPSTVGSEIAVPPVEFESPAFSSPGPGVPAPDPSHAEPSDPSEERSD